MLTKQRWRSIARAYSKLADSRNEPKVNWNTHGYMGVPVLTTPEEEEEIMATVRDHILNRNGLEMDATHYVHLDLLLADATCDWDPAKPPETEATKCGATHCVAGWVQALCPVKKLREGDAILLGQMLVPRYAGEDGENFFITNEAALKRLKISKRDYAKAKKRFDKQVAAYLAEMNDAR